METTTELCYYTKRLQDYLSDSFPELANDKQFIKEQADTAAQAYSDAFLEGYPIEGCNEIANEALFKGLHFSKYDTLFEVLNREFDRELKEEQLRPFAKQMLPVCEPVFEQYPIDDDFAATPEYDKLYTELTGVIVLWIEENGLPQ